MAFDDNNIDDLNYRLQDAIDKEDVNKILELVRLGADPNTISSILEYSVLEAICFFSRDIEHIKFLIEKGVDPNGIATNEGSFSGLHCACINLNIEMVKYFLDLGVDVNSECRYNYVPISYAWWQYGDTGENPSRIIKLLIDNGANIYDREGELLEWIDKSFKEGFRVVEYYNKYSTNSENLKPAKRK
jgi:ankyrin repeat protein